MRWGRNNASTTGLSTNIKLLSFYERAPFHFPRLNLHRGSRLLARFLSFCSSFCQLARRRRARFGVGRRGVEKSSPAFTPAGISDGANIQLVARQKTASLRELQFLAILCLTFSSGRTTSVRRCNVLSDRKFCSRSIFCGGSSA